MWHGQDVSPPHFGDPSHVAWTEQASVIILQEDKLPFRLHSRSLDFCQSVPRFLFYSGGLGASSLYIVHQLRSATEPLCALVRQ